MYLHDRPRSFVKPCIEKPQLATSINYDEICYLNEGEYKVKNYSVDIGSTSDRLWCECFDWNRHKLPCKHIMRLVSHTSFTDIAKSYRLAPYYALDASVIPGYKEKEGETTTEHPINVVKNLEEAYNEKSFTEIPKQKFPKRTKAVSCRELMQEIKSLTFITDDEEALDTLEEGLLDLRDLLLSSCPVDEGFVIEQKKKVTIKE